MKMVMDEDRLVRVRDAAATLAVSRSTLYALMDRGAVSYIKIGRARRIRQADLRRLISTSQVGGRK